jgi:Rrf2 family protein
VVARVRISARADYALRACIELAAAGERMVTSQALAEAQGISPSFLQNILQEMRRARLLRTGSRIGGGYQLARPPEETSVADILRAIDGPFVSVHGIEPRDVHYPESTESLATLWIAVRANIEAVLDNVSLRDVATSRLPESVSQLAGAGTARGGLRLHRSAAATPAT